MKAKLITAAGVVAALVLVVAAGYVFCVRADLFKAGHAALAAIYVLLVAASVPFCDVLHECGHLVAGLCCKMRVKLSRWRPFKSSSVSVDPVGCKSMRARMLATSLGGLAVNAITFALGVAALCTSAMPSAFAALAPYSAYLLIVNAVPCEGEGKNDGLVASELIRLTDSSRVMLAVLRAQGMVNGGVPLANIPQELLFDLPQLPEDDVNFIILTRLRAEYFSARGDAAEAEKYFDRFEQIKCYLPEGYAERQ